MKGVDTSLRALKTLAEFELADTGRELGLAVTQNQAEHERVTDAAMRCATTVRDLRRVMRQQPANTELVAALHRLYRHQRLDLYEAKERLRAAKQKEAQLRDAMNERFVREKLLGRTLRLQIEAQRAALEGLQLKLLEDAWLSSIRRGGA
jgi:ABC-type uncharacterized transport system fused permease/ATPase subunit